VYGRTSEPSAELDSGSGDPCDGVLEMGDGDSLIEYEKKEHGILLIYHKESRVVVISHPASWGSMDS
jgi:hypothetical protein